MDFKIELHGVGKTYNGRPVLRGLDGNFLPGKSYVIAGPNGSGKSTLLRIICGLTRPSSGEVRVVAEGKHLKEAHEKGTLMGYLSPELNLYERLTAYENLFFFASLKGAAPGENEIAELLEKVQLKPYMHFNAGTFSSGMKQRLKLAFVLLNHPPVLLLDEPSTNLDEAGKKLVEELVREQQQRGTVILASNEPGEVEKFGQEKILLGAGSQGTGVERPGRRV